MKQEFIHARWKGNLKLSKPQIDRLPERIGLAGTVQFLHLLPGIKEQLEKAGKDVKLVQADNCVEEGQVLGCSKFKLRRVDAILYIGDGVFHPINLRLGFKGNVFVNMQLINNRLIIEVEDDGIGRAKAKAFQEKKAKTHTSRATSIILERIDSINKTRKQKMSLLIDDLYNEWNEPVGTRVVIEIPNV